MVIGPTEDARPAGQQADRLSGGSAGAGGPHPAIGKREAEPADASLLADVNGADARDENGHALREGVIDHEVRVPDGASDDLSQGEHERAGPRFRHRRHDRAPSVARFPPARRSGRRRSGRRTCGRRPHPRRGIVGQLAAGTGRLTRTLWGTSCRQSVRRGGRVGVRAVNTTEVPQPAVGEPWAYRARHVDPLVQVVVVRLGVKTPRRVLVRFVDEEFEGLQDWVPPARLKVPWAGVEEFAARERRWDAVVAGAPPDRDGPEESAADAVFDLLIAPELAVLGWNATRGVIRVHDVAGLAAFLDVEPSALRADGVSFEEDGDLISPWPVALAVARRAAARDPQRVLRHVEEEEADARREATYGSWHRRRGAPDDHIPAEICASVDEEHGRPVRALLRGWCGADAVDLRGEISSLRREAAGAAELAQSAVDCSVDTGTRATPIGSSANSPSFDAGMVRLVEAGRASRLRGGTPPRRRFTKTTRRAALTPIVEESSC